MNAEEKRAERGQSCCCTYGWIEEFARFKHGVHNDGQFAGNGYCSPFEADPFPYETCARVGVDMGVDC
ncbi:hypothetical protein [Novosphingobium sp. PY1]|uniref:hypothetical protein n=1 Tax=Novosphingobium sp. PY1 TaxID=1882221 RepID=UPI001A8CBBE2|nr:hypothetical protein [Novosphingobium sp. PY1]GFM30311.1 Beta-lactamase [Novosphingobium sp. PY1]